MMRTRQSQQQPTLESILFSIDGPRFLLANQTIERAYLNETWMEFLTRTLNLELEGIPGRLIICSYTFMLKRLTPEGGGHFAELEDKVADFVQKYQRRRKMYVIRLRFEVSEDGNPQQQRLKTPPGTSKVAKRHIMRPSPIPGSVNNRNNSLDAPSMTVPSTVTGLSASQVRQERSNLNTRMINDVTGRSDNVQSTVTGREDGFRRSIGVPELPAGYPMTPAAFNIQRKRSSTKNNYGSRVPNAGPGRRGNHERFEEPLWAQNWDVPDDEVSKNTSTSASSTGRDRQPTNGSTIGGDDESCFTSASEDATDMRQEGIPVRDIKTNALQQFSRLSNSFLLRLEKEYRNGQQKNAWILMMGRFPFTAHLMHQIFSERIL